MANADFVNNLMREWNTAYQHAQLAKEQYIKRQDGLCAELHFNVCKVIGGKVRQDTGMIMYRSW